MSNSNNNQSNIPQTCEAGYPFKIQATQEVGVNLTNGYNGYLTFTEIRFCRKGNAFRSNDEIFENQPNCYRAYTDGTMHCHNKCIVSVKPSGGLK